MKKILFIMMLGLLWSSCSNEEVVVPPSDNTATTALRTKEEAIAIAENLNAARQENGSRATAKTLKSVDIIGSTNSRTASDTLIYALNYDDNAGFVLVSAAKTGIAVIGYTDEGNFDSEQAAENPNFSYYLDAAKSYVSTQALTPTGPIIDPSTPQTLRQFVIPSLFVEWGQRYPEGMYCPNKISGCVQTAMAQMMSYIGKPTSIALTYSERDINSQALNWNEIKEHKKSINTMNASEISKHLSGCNTTESSHQALGRLCRQLGFLNNASYNTESTGASSATAYKTFKSLCPSNTFTDFKYFNSDFSNLWDDLYANDGVAYLRGSDSSAGGHAWVCEGAEHAQTISNLLKADGTYEKFVEDRYYYYFNWGWCGDDNGYFDAGVFNNEKPSSRYNFNSGPKYFVVYK